MLTNPAPANPSPMGKGSLGRQLVLRVVLLVAVAAILLSGATTLATRQLLVTQTDRQLDAVTDRLKYGGGGEGGPQRGLLQPGQPIGTIAVAYDESGADLSSGIVKEKVKPQTLSDAAVSRLATIVTGGSKTSVDVPGLGRYRVASYDAVIVSGSSKSMGRIVVGLPLSMVNNTLIQLVGIEAILSILAMAGAAAGARTLIARSLRPLNRVATTAQHVSQLPLDRGEVALAVRVPEQDTDPANEVGRVGQAFNHMLNNVEAALEARQASETKVRQFVADASHELRNPLASIRGYAELTRRERSQLPEGASFALARIEAESVRMSSLVEDLLLLARLDSGPALVLGDVDLSEVVLNAVSDARAAGPDQRWQLELPDEPVVVSGDQHRLHQVVVNLLANARTHTPDGTSVRTSIRTEADHAVIMVADDGPGVPPAIAERVFERFTRADASRARSDSGGQSTGLGLAIVAAVVDAHHGSVHAVSVPGDTRFEIRLPLLSVPTNGSLP